jgi:ABC-type phosphate/phosphonate transport system substrate-binding protein
VTAALGMYDPPFAQWANDAWWQNLAGHARALGLCAAPSLERARPYREVWEDRELELAQTCGLPLVTRLKNMVRLVASPCYDFAGCQGPQYRSLIVVRAEAEFFGLEGLRGKRVAINSRDSHSGCNALAHAVSQRAQGGMFFSGHIVTRAHLTSLASVRERRADACACDCVTFGLIARHAPASLQGLSVIGETEAAPAPPFITQGDASDAELAGWREALARSLADPQSAAAREFLGLAGMEVLTEAAYGRIGEMMTDLAVLGPLEES